MLDGEKQTTNKKTPRNISELNACTCWKHSDVGPKGLAPPGPLAGVWWRALGFQGKRWGKTQQL